MKCHHVGIATAHLDKTVGVYQQLGYAFEPPEVFTDPIQRVRIAFVAAKGSPLIEIVTPLNETSPINDILKKVRTSPYHTCYEVSDIDDKCRELQKLRFGVAVKPVETIAFQQRRVCFLYHAHMGLVELLEAES